MLAHFLLQKQPEQNDSHSLDGVRLLYTLSKSDLKLTLRQDVEGIKVTLGEISLLKDEDHEFNPFEWAQASAQAHSKTLAELASLKSQASSEQETINKLNAQLEDFIKTKKEAETLMLQQFMDLLNEKKRKIRDQSRLLAGAKVDETVATTIQASRRNTAKSKPRKAGSSRSSKRKAPVQEADDVQENSDSDQMETDQAKEEEQGDDEDVPAVTPDPSDNETEGEDEVTARREGSSQTIGVASAARPSKADTPEPEPASKPPPKRELPFGRPATRSKPPPPAEAPSSEDDETDEEL